MTSRLDSTRRQSMMVIVYIGVILLGCKSGQWQTQPASPPAAVEQKSSLEMLRQDATAARGDATKAIQYATAVAAHLSAGEPANVDADPGVALELLQAAAAREPLRGAELDHARGDVEFALRDYQVAVATYETNARKRGHAKSATSVVRYYAAAGDREALEVFCNDVYPIIRGGDDKNEFISECILGMGYASPAEWTLVSGPALSEYERWRTNQAQAVRDEQAQKAASARAEHEQRIAAEQADRDKRNCVLRCAEKESLCKSNCYEDQCRRDCSNAEWACRRQC